MKMAVLIKIETIEYYNYTTYETVDKFIKLDSDDETVEEKIMNKYPQLGNIEHCYNKIVYDSITKINYLIVSFYL
jgi:hypothetical protein